MKIGRHNAKQENRINIKMITKKNKQKQGNIEMGKHEAKQENGKNMKIRQHNAN